MCVRVMLKPELQPSKPLNPEGWTMANHFTESKGLVQMAILEQHPGALLASLIDHLDGLATRKMAMPKS